MQRGVWVQIQEKDRKTYLQALGYWEKQWMTVGSIVNTSPVCSPAMEPLWRSSLDPFGTTEMLTWNRLPDISLGKMSLFRIDWELDFGICNLVSSGQIPCVAREGEGFCRGERKVGEL